MTVNVQPKNPFAPASGAELVENQRALSRRTIIVYLGVAVLILVCLLGCQFGIMIGMRIGGGV